MINNFETLDFPSIDSQNSESIEIINTIENPNNIVIDNLKRIPKKRQTLSGEIFNKFPKKKRIIENFLWFKKNKKEKPDFFLTNNFSYNPYRYINNSEYWTNLNKKENLSTDISESTLTDLKNESKKSLYFQRNYITKGIKQITKKDPNESNTQKLTIEKRKKYQAYMALDYLLASYSYFDYFSENAIEVILFAKMLGKEYFRDDITYEILYAAFFSNDISFSSFIEMINESGLEKVVIQKFTGQLQNFQQKKFYYSRFTKPFLSILPLGRFVFELAGIIVKKFERKNKFLERFKNFCFKSDKNLKNFENLHNTSRYENIAFYQDVHSLFLKATENARLRFKTPIVNLPILFITLMELKKSKIATHIKKNLTNHMEYDLLKYRLMRELHNEEVSIRFDMDQNQRFFVYLLKSQLKEDEFTRLVDENTIGKVTSHFRNKLIISSLGINVFKLMKLDIFYSSKLPLYQR